MKPIDYVKAGIAAAIVGTLIFLAAVKDNPEAVAALIEALSFVLGFFGGTPI